MRRSHVIAVLAVLVLAAPRSSAAQGSGGSATAAATVTAAQGAAGPATGARGLAIEPPQSRWVRTLTNVQIELTIADQTGAAAPEKKTVSMVVSSGSWGKIRSAGNVGRPGMMPPVVVDLNVDARPMVSVDGLIQLELTIAYSPLGSPTVEESKAKPPTVNQSLTVILQSGKPLVISQAADPIGDRKIILEAKATVLK